MEPQKIEKFIDGTAASAEEAKKLNQQARYETLKHAVRNAKMALMETGIDPGKVSVAQLPEDILGQEHGGRITIDEVVFKDYETLIRTLQHEELHAEGIDNDGLVELIISGIRGGTPFYKEEVRKVQQVTDVIGIDFAKNLYQSEQYTELFMRFKRLHARKFPEAKTEAKTEEKNAEKIFFEAFSELIKKN